jgi:hypothetical protein
MLKHRLVPLSIITDRLNALLKSIWLLKAAPSDHPEVYQKPRRVALGNAPHVLDF